MMKRLPCVFCLLSRYTEIRRCFLYFCCWFSCSGQSTYRCFYNLKSIKLLFEEAKHALREGRIGDSQELNASIEQWAEIYGQDLAYRKAPVTELKIALLIRTGRLEDAEQAARENIQSTLLYRGEKYKDYLSHLELLADVLSMEKKTAEAYSIYEEILVRLQRDYPYEKKWIRKIMDQLTSAL